MGPELDEADKRKMAEMLERFQHFLQRYEGFAVVISTAHFWQGGAVKSDTRIELAKMAGAPKIVEPAVKLYS